MSSPTAGEIDWTWSMTNPDHWTSEESFDGGVTWTFFGSYVGSLRSDPTFDSGVDARIRGYDAANNPVTLYSNVVAVS